MRSQWPLLKLGLRTPGRQGLRVHGTAGPLRPPDGCAPHTLPDTGDRGTTCALQHTVCHRTRRTRCQTRCAGANCTGASVSAACNDVSDPSAAPVQVHERRTCTLLRTMTGTGSRVTLGQRQVWMCFWTGLGSWKGTKIGRHVVGTWLCHVMSISHWSQASGLGPLWPVPYSTRGAPLLSSWEAPFLVQRHGMAAQGSSACSVQFQSVLQARLLTYVIATCGRATPVQSRWQDSRTLHSI